jgi:hypothetical protein
VFKVFRATRKGNKLALEATRICQGAINYLVSEGKPVKLPDTVFVLSESYSLCCVLALEPWMNELHRGQMLVHSSEIVRDWLRQVCVAADPAPNYDAAIKTFSESIVPYFGDWFDGLAAERPELSGREQFVLAAIERFGDHVANYSAEKHGSDFREVRAIALGLCSTSARTLN